MSNEPTIEQMNEAIALFMGNKPYEDSRYGILWNSPVDGKTCFSLQYHSSWDWLKPVINEIFNYALAHPEQVKAIIDMSVVVDISAAHEKVYQFISWHNDHSKLNQAATKLMNLPQDTEPKGMPLPSTDPL